MGYVSINHSRSIGKAALWIALALALYFGADAFQRYQRAEAIFDLVTEYGHDRATLVSDFSQYGLVVVNDARPMTDMCVDITNDRLGKRRIVRAVGEYRHSDPKISQYQTAKDCSRAQAG